MSAEAHELIIPWTNIYVQAFNLIALLALLTYLLRHAVKKHFAERAQSYRELVDRAENARREAEASNAQIKARLANLEISSKQTVERARAEGEELRQRLHQEAKEATHKFELEARRTIAVELEKAKAELRRDLLQQSLQATEKSLKKSLGSSDQKKLQNEFVEKIEVVGG